MPGQIAIGTMAAMLITRHHDAARELAPGCRVARLSDPEQSDGAFETWRLWLDPGAASPWAAHDKRQVVLVLSGIGKLRLASGPYRFGAASTLVVAPRTEHQFVNLGPQALELIAIRNH